MGIKVKLIFLFYGFVFESFLLSEIIILKGFFVFNRFYVDLKLRGLKKWGDGKILKEGNDIGWFGRVEMWCLWFSVESWFLRLFV